MRREGTAALIAILVVASIGIGYLAGSRARRTETITSTTTMVTDALASSTASSSATSTATSGVAIMHYVVFEQSGYCLGSPVIYYENLWSVTLGNETQLKTWNSTQTIANDTVSVSTNPIFSTVVFSVPDGSYNFSISPDYFSPDSGMVLVNGSNVAVKLDDSVFVNFCPP